MPTETYKHSSYLNKNPGTFDEALMKSINNYRKAKTTYEQADDKIGAIISLISIGNAYHFRYENSNACEAYNEAMMLYNTATQDGAALNGSLVLGKKYKTLGDVITAYLKRENCGK